MDLTEDEELLAEKLTDAGLTLEEARRWVKDIVIAAEKRVNTKDEIDIDYNEVRWLREVMPFEEGVDHEKLFVKPEMTILGKTHVSYFESVMIDGVEYTLPAAFKKQKLDRDEE